MPDVAKDGVPITLELRTASLSALGPLAMESPKVMERLAGYMDAAGWPDGLNAKLRITAAHLYATDAQGNMLLQAVPDGTVPTEPEPPAAMPPEIPGGIALSGEPPAEMPPPLHIVQVRRRTAPAKPPVKGARRR